VVNNVKTLQVSVRGRNGQSQAFTVTSRGTIGKGADCDIVLKGMLIGKVQASIEQRKDHWYLEDKGGLASTLVNGNPVTQYGPLTETDVIEIGSFTLTVSGDIPATGPGDASSAASVQAFETAPAERLASIGQEAVAEVALTVAEAANEARHRIAVADRAAVQHGSMSGRLTEANAPTMPRLHAPVSHGSSMIVSATTEVALAPSDGQTLADVPLVMSAINAPAGIELRKTAHSRLIAAMDLRRINVASMSEQELSDTVGALLRGVLASDPVFESAGISADDLFKSVFDEVIGLGPLESLLADDSITEIMVNRYNEIFIERAGQLSRSDTLFTDDQAVMGAIERIVAPLGRRIDESSPMVDARLKDGSRVNAVVPPLALKGPNITIRKFSRRKLQSEDLVRFGSLSQQMADFLKVAVELRANIVISGGTGSGKTTLLNVLSNFIPDHERIVTVEDAAELQLSQGNLVSLEARPANAEGRGAVSIRDLVKNTLRMRPDRIVVGECRGGEALDMLQAMNTGHDGSLTTAHANSPRDCLSRLEVMTLMAGLDLPITAIREQVVSAVHLIVQQTRFSCGSRRVTHVTEVSGIEAGTVQLQDIFVFKQTGYGQDGRVRGEFKSTGYVPDFYQDLIRRGIGVDTSIFST